MLQRVRGDVAFMLFCLATACVGGSMILVSGLSGQLTLQVMLACTSGYSVFAVGAINGVGMKGGGRLWMHAGNAAGAMIIPLAAAVLDTPLMYAGSVLAVVLALWGLTREASARQK